jgi:hypothetical protein
MRRGLCGRWAGRLARFEAGTRVFWAPEREKKKNSDAVIKRTTVNAEEVGV